MTKLIPLFLLLLVTASCGKSGSSSSKSGSLETIGSDYYPKGLDDKLIRQNEEVHAPMNFLTQSLTMTFDPAAQKITGHSSITFKLKHDGRPYFELQGTLKNIKMNNSNTTATSIKDPDGQNQSYWSINETVSSNETHTVEFDYDLPTSRVTFTDGGVRFLTDMTDLSGKFFEYWGPVGFEEDAFSMNLKLVVKNSTSTHKLYTNGDITSSDSSTWQIRFPDFFTKSSFYVHLTNSVLPSKSFVYKGLKKDIPITVYGVTQSLVNTAVSQLPDLFKELEGDYGPYHHDKFLAYMNDRSGGMEYVGATITSVASLDHELLHSWFARSVIPADGRSGWIDEAMASWRDYGYTRARTTLTRSATNLANYSPFRKTTPSNSYVDGRGLFAELDSEFASQGGLKPVMKALADKYKHNIITNEEFWNFLEEKTGMDLSAFQDRYVMGNSKEVTTMSKSISTEVVGSKHPTPLTEEEILRLR